MHQVFITTSNNGLINSEFKKLGSLSPDDKKKVASEINNAKQELTYLFNDKLSNLETAEIDERVKKEKIEEIEEMQRN